MKSRQWSLPAALTGALLFLLYGPAPASEHGQGFIYGRVLVDDGRILEGRLRWGGNEEAFWSEYFNAFKDHNPWASHVDRERLTTTAPIEVFGFELGSRERPIDLDRPFMIRFGDIARIDADGPDLRVTLKSGAAIELDRFGADDFADGLTVWDPEQGVVTLDEWRVRSVELLATTALEDPPNRLRGTVRSGRHEFSGFVQWNREAGVGSDTVQGRSAGGEVRLRFDDIRMLRRSNDGLLATLRDGSTVALSGSRDAGPENRGIYVNDPRYGRVLVAWDVFEELELEDAPGSGPGYDDFPVGSPLAGSVTLRDGRRLAGRLVYDLDESETTETLDAPAEGVNYTIPFGLIASIVPAEDAARVTLQSGETLTLANEGDLGTRNAGLLVFTDPPGQPAYVPWREVVRVDLDRPPAMFPPLSAH